MTKHGAFALTTFLAVALLPAGRVMAASTVALWHMEDPDTLIDSSGNENHGETTDIDGVRGTEGDGYQFNGDTSVVKVQSSASLNPGDDDIQFTVHIRFERVPNTDYDVIRKGLGDTEGGEYKMQVAPSQDGEQARANCTFHGSVADGKVNTDVNVADGDWHTVTCSKTADAIEIVVDEDRQTEQVQIGTISNDEPLTIGAKTFPDDQFRGDMDEVSVRIG